MAKSDTGKIQTYIEPPDMKMNTDSQPAAGSTPKASSPKPKKPTA